MSKDKIGPESAGAYAIAYHSTRVWGCLQKGWLMMDEERTEQMWESLRKLTLYVPALDMEDEMEAILEYEKTGEAEHVRLSALWRTLMENWEDAEKGFGDLVGSICNNLCAFHQVSQSTRKLLSKNVKSSLEKLGNDSVRAFTKVAINKADENNALPSALGTDIARTLHFMERTIFDAPDNPYDLDQWNGPKICFEDRIKYFPGATPETDPEAVTTLPGIMRKLVENEVKFYPNLRRLWIQSLRSGSNQSGTVKRWFDLGRDLAFLIDQPAIPESVLRQYFSEYFADQPDLDYDPWVFSSKIGLEGDWEQAREHVRNLPLDDISDQSDITEWAFSAHKQAEDFVQEQEPVSKKEMEETGPEPRTERPAESGEPDKEKTISLNDLAEDFLTFSRNNNASKTAKSYESGLKYILKDVDAYKDKPATEISPMDIESVKNNMKGNGLSARSINKMVGAVKRVYNWAVDYGMINENPVKGVEKVSSHVNAPDHVPQKHLNLDKAKQYIKLCGDSPPLGDICNFLLHTGMRIGELVDLRWDDIDDGAKIIRLHKHKTSSRTGKPRTIPLVKNALEIIEKQKKQRKEKGNSSPEDPVFVGEKGQQFKVSALQNRLKRLRKKHSELEELTFHKFRHTCATLLAKSGVREQVAQQILGHSSSLMTRYYTAIDSEDMKEAGEKLSDTIGAEE